MVRVGSESLRGNNLRYVSADAWCPGLLKPLHDQDALNSLAARYLAAFGPARIEDFRWWTGVSKPLAVKAMASVETVDLGGLLLPATDLPAFEQTTPLPADALVILPKWDSYTMGYAPDGRARFVDSEMQSRVYINVGDGLGVVLLAGKAVAAWSSKFTGNRMDITLDCFDDSAAAHIENIEEQFGEVARVLDGTACKITLHEADLAASRGYNRVRKTASSSIL